jgi:hypothetical protein
MMSGKTISGAALGALLMAGATAAQAAPISASGPGVVIAASGLWAPFLGTTVNASATFDLDELNAYAKELIAPSGEPPFTRWTFNSSPAFNPYGAMFSGAFGSFSSGTVWLETLDNFDADAAGNPFGLSGIVDVLSIVAGDVVVDCSMGTVDPVTGCSDPNAPLLGGTEFQVHVVAASDWFMGDAVLPTSLFPANQIGVWGNGDLFQGETVIGHVEIDFNSVPGAATLGLVGLGLLGLGCAGYRRRG